MSLSSIARARLSSAVLQLSRPSARNMTLLAPYAKEHEDSRITGAGDGRPTARRIIEDQGLVGKLAGKVMIVTGCSSGIGVETARALHETGADVYMTVRTIEKGLPILEDVRSDKGPGKVELLELDLSDLASVRKGAADFLSKSSQLNVLVNNAGVMACPHSTTKDGFEMQFGTNHLGHFLFFQLLKPALLASSTPDFNSRVISVSSSGHRNSGVVFEDIHFKEREYAPFLAYGQSKTANIYFANEIDRRYGAKGLHALSLHPGGIATPLQRHIDPATIEGWKKNPESQRMSKSTQQGAATSVWAAVAKEWEGKGGRFLENCQDAPPVSEEGGPSRPGHAKHAYDEAAEKRIWVESLKMVGLEDDQ